MIGLCHRCAALCQVVDGVITTKCCLCADVGGNCLLCRAELDAGEEWGWLDPVTDQIEIDYVTRLQAIAGACDRFKVAIARLLPRSVIVFRLDGERTVRIVDHEEVRL
jgi:hypothetical protein